jgi:hypothetical protein
MLLPKEIGPAVKIQVMKPLISKVSNDIYIVWEPTGLGHFRKSRQTGHQHWMMTKQDDHTWTKTGEMLPSRNVN